MDSTEATHTKQIADAIAVHEGYLELQISESYESSPQDPQPTLVAGHTPAMASEEAPQASDAGVLQTDVSAHTSIFFTQELNPTLDSNSEPAEQEAGLSPPCPPWDTPPGETGAGGRDAATGLIEEQQDDPINLFQAASGLPEAVEQDVRTPVESHKQPLQAEEAGAPAHAEQLEAPGTSPLQAYGSLDLDELGEGLPYSPMAGVNDVPARSALSAPTSPAFRQRTGSALSPTLYSTKRYETLTSLGVPRQGPLHDVTQLARCVVEECNTWFVQKAEAVGRIDQGRTRRLTRVPSAQTHLATPVTLVNTNNIPPAALAVKREQQFQQEWDTNSYKHVYASDIQIARTNGVHMRLDELGFTCSLRASEAAAEAAVARKARAEEEAKQRLAAAAAHESRVIARANELLAQRAVALEAKLAAKHACGSARVQDMRHRRSSSLQAASSALAERVARAADAKKQLDEIRAALAAQDAAVTKSKLERIVTPVQEPPTAPAPSPAGPVYHRYALLEAKRAAQRAAKTEWIDSMLMTRDANRSRLLQDTQRALSASSMRREQQHQQLLNQQQAARAAVAARVVSKHDTISAACKRRDVLRAAQELDQQLCRRTQLMSSYWSKELQLTAAQVKHVPSPRHEVVSMLTAWTGATSKG